MHILVLQETDWLSRGPHIQHHIFERLSKNPLIKITVIDYDIDKVQQSNSHFIKKRIYQNIDRTIKNSNVKIIRTAHLQIPFVRRLSSLFTNFFQTLEIIRKDRPDIIISYSMTNGLIGLILAKLFNIPYIFHYIDILHELVPIKFAQGIARVITRFILKFSDRNLVFTKIQKYKVINEGASPQRTLILPNGISIENTTVDEEKRQNLKKKFNIKNDDFVIFFMGYLYDFAGLTEIVDYYNVAVKNGKICLKFLILGDGGIYKTLITHVNKFGAEWVILVGRVPFFDINEYISLADLCLLSFKINDITKEIIPIKIIEYMAMKKPILSNNLPGVLFEMGKSKGIIFAKNQKDLIKKIGELIPQKDEIKKIGQAGYKFVKNKYVWPKIILGLKKIIIGLIKVKNSKYKRKI